MNRKEAKQYLSDNNWPTGRELQAKKHSDFLKWLKLETKFLDESPKMSKVVVRLHAIEFDIYNIPQCKACGNPVKSFSTDGITDDRVYKVRIANYCSVSCSANSDETRKKRNSTNIERYGDDPSRTDDVKNKRKETMRSRYGVEHNSKLEDFHEKRKKTMLDRYGAEDWMHVPTNVDYVKSVWKDKYQEGHPARSQAVQQKMKKTSLDRYGEETFLKTPEFQQKRVQTCMERYGEETHMRVPEIKERVLAGNRNNHNGKLHTRLHLTDEAIRVLSSKEKLEELYEEKKFMRLVADELGCSFSAVQRAMADLGITANQTHKSSIGELEVAEFIESLGFETIRSDRSILTPYEADIVVPDRKLIIEYNGVWWHSEEHKPKKYHQEKSLAAHQSGYEIVHVWEDDWMDDHKRQIVKNKIKAKLGVSDNKVYARKTTIKEPTKKEVRDLMDSNHIQGFVGYTHAYGLYEGESLVACLTLRKTKETGIYDLNRFATSKTVVGGMSKLLSFIKNNLEFREIFTYAHLDYSSGSVYEKSGFEKKHITPPGMWYVKKGEDVRVRRERFMKHKLTKIFGDVDMSKTEAEIMNSQGYYRVYDAGSIKYTLT